MSSKIKVYTSHVNPKNQEAADYYSGLKKDLKRLGLLEVQRLKRADILVVVGGDSTMLRAIRRAVNSGFNKPILGLNFGTKGFLLNETRDDAADMIATADFKEYNFPILSLSVTDLKGVTHTDFAINEVSFERKVTENIGGQSCKLSLTVNKIVTADIISGNGIVISTALGSTAYNLAAGGSAVYATLDTISIAPLVACAPIQIKPLVFPDFLIEVEVLEPEERQVIARCDSEKGYCARRASIKMSSKSFKMALFEGEDFTKRLVSKIMKAPR